MKGEAEHYGVYYGNTFCFSAQSRCDTFNGAGLYYFDTGERYDGEFSDNPPPTRFVRVVDVMNGGVKRQQHHAKKTSVASGWPRQPATDGA